LKTATGSTELEYLLDVCDDLALTVTPDGESSANVLSLRGPNGEPIRVDIRSEEFSMLEQVLKCLRFRFEDLTLLVNGDSKEIRLLTPRIALARLRPTVYSFTSNRYGIAPGTEIVRSRFSAKLFRSMACEPGSVHLSSAFLGLIETPSGPLMAEELVETCNLEVRVKRFHVGSPVHRYRYTDRHRSALLGEPISRWTRFAAPVVCFDWRNPMVAEDGSRLADEPLSDDYAALWIDDVPKAKLLACDAFQWIERRFLRAGLQLIDICFFIDRTGSVLYGEISPDCMRVRNRASADSEALDKDHWRSGGEPEEVLARYEKLYEMVFRAKQSTPAAGDK